MPALRDITKSAVPAPATIPDTGSDTGQTPDTGHALTGFQGRGHATVISSAGPAIAATRSLAKPISMATIAITPTSTTIAWVLAGVVAFGGSGPYRIGLISNPAEDELRRWRRLALNPFSTSRAILRYSR